MNWDHPLLSLLRQEWLSWHHRRYAQRIAECWPLSGDSKTIRCIRKNGFLVGLAISHSAFVVGLTAFARDAPLSDALLSPVPDGDVSQRCRDLIDEWVSVGMPLAEAKNLSAQLIEDFNFAASQFAATCARLRSDPRLHEGALSIIPLNSAAPSQLEKTAIASDPRQYVVTYVPPPGAVAELLLPLRELDRVTPHDPWFRNPPHPLQDMALEEDIAESLALAVSTGVLPQAPPGGPAPFTAALLINASHLNRLRALYSSCAESEWVYRLFCLLARYETVTAGGSARGFQGALPPRVFAVLEKHLGVTGECFASPMNCSFPQAFCSAYTDTDTAFSSLGSFFAPSFAPREGSWEVNPPFTNAALSATVSRMCDLLEVAHHAGGSLLFFFVTPSWPLAPFAQHLERCPWVCTSGLLVGGEHAYVDGMQHRENEFTLEWQTQAGSCYYILATEAAKRRYCIATATKALTQAFKDAAGVVNAEQEATMTVAPT